jgi:mono/diheme cytochrome c family protein
MASDGPPLLARDLLTRIPRGAQIMAKTVLVAALIVSVATAVAIGQTRPPAQARLILDSLTGRDSFEFYCATCHGVTGRGDGPVAPALKAPAADLTSLARRNGGMFPRQQVLSLLTGTGRQQPTAHGPSDMPVWGPVFRFLDPSDVRVKVRIENLVAHIATLQAK